MKMPKKATVLKQKSPKTQKQLAKWIPCPFCRLRFLNLEEDEHRERCSADSPLSKDFYASLGLLLDNNTLVARVVTRSSGRYCLNFLPDFPFLPLRTAAQNFPF